MPFARATDRQHRDARARRTRHEHRPRPGATTTSPPSSSPCLVGLTGLGALLDAALTATGTLVSPVGRLDLAVLPVVVPVGGPLVRERREDAADALAGPPGALEHMPHLAAQIHPPPTGATSGRGWPDVGRHRMGDRYWLRVTLILAAAVAVCWLALGEPAAPSGSSAWAARRPLRATCPASCSASGPTQPATAPGGRPRPALPAPTARTGVHGSVVPPAPGSPGYAHPTQRLADVHSSTATTAPNHRPGPPRPARPRPPPAGRPVHTSRVYRTGTHPSRPRPATVAGPEFRVTPTPCSPCSTSDSSTPTASSASTPVRPRPARRAAHRLRAHRHPTRPTSSTPPAGSDASPMTDTEVMPMTLPRAHPQTVTALEPTCSAPGSAPPTTASGAPRSRPPAAAPPPSTSPAPPRSSTATAPSCSNAPGTVLAPCGNRRAAVCPACSDRYAADAYHLLRAGLAGDDTKDVPDTVTEHPRAFLTLTAPSFGPVHTRKLTRRGHVIPCRCGDRHHPDDPRLGTALDPDSYDYEARCCGRPTPAPCGPGSPPPCAAPWPPRLGVRRRAFPEHARLSYAKVAEYQRRGLVHFHAVIRLDGPDGPTDPHRRARPTALRDAITTAAPPPPSPPTDPTAPRWCSRWGTQLDLRPITSTAAAAARGRPGRSPTPRWPATSPSTPPKATGAHREGADRPIRDGDHIAYLDVTPPPPHDRNRLAARRSPLRAR